MLKRKKLVSLMSNINDFKNILKILEDNFKIKNVFTFNVLNTDKIFLTFYIDSDSSIFLEMKEMNIYILPINKKGNTFYTINGLNELINRDYIDNEQIGNVDYKKIKINWDDYENKLILFSSNEFNIYDIERF